MKILPFLAVVCVLATPAVVGQVKVTNPEDQKILSAFLRHAEKVPKRLTKEYCRNLAARQAEGYTWLVVPQLNMTLTAYELSGEEKYLDGYVQAFENMRAALSEGTDGFLGWHGKALGNFKDPDDPDKQVDVIITSFRVAHSLARFAELTGAETALREKYATQRSEYLRLAQDHLVKKWDERGNYVDLGETGGIYRTHPGLRDVKGNLTQPHNKHSLILRSFLALYRVTGEDRYMRRAIKLGTRFKHCLTLKDGHYEWNYWDPAGKWDVRSDNPKEWKHWIGPEHRSGYYSSSLSQAVELYHHGVVFDEQDMERFLKTQLEMCWNGSFENPKWARVDGTSPKRYTKGSYICAALAPFEEKIARFLYEGQRRKERLERRNHPWQGGVVASGWIHGKYVRLPSAKGNGPMYGKMGAEFLETAEHRKWMAELRFSVKPPGYSAPGSPDQMKPLPEAPNPRAATRAEEQ